MEENHAYFKWSGQRLNESRTVSIWEYKPGQFNGGTLLENHRKIVAIIKRQWGLETHYSLWDARCWRDYYDWRKLVGSRRSSFRPTHVIEITVCPKGFKPICIISHPFRLAKLGLSKAQCAESIGAFAVLIYDHYPAIGEKRAEVIVKSPTSEESLTWWLGVILQASRQL